MGSFGNICRLCCREKKNLIAVFKNSDNKISIADQIKKLLAIEVLHEDNLPQSICKACTNKLDELEQFVDLSHRAQQTLAELYVQTVLARKRAQDGQEITVSDDENSLVPALLLQELRKNMQEQEHSVLALQLNKTVTATLAFKEDYDPVGKKRKCRGQRKPIKAVRKSMRHTSIANCADDHSDSLKINNVKVEILDQNLIAAPKALHQRTVLQQLQCSVPGEQFTALQQLQCSVPGEQFIPVAVGQPTLIDKEHFPIAITGTENIDNSQVDKLSDGAGCNIALCCNNSKVKDSSTLEYMINSRTMEHQQQLRGSPIIEDQTQASLDLHVREPIIIIEEACLKTTEVVERPLDISADETDMQALKFDEETSAQEIKLAQPLRHIARCAVCRSPFFALSSLLLHQRMHHEQEPTPACPLMCVYCSHTYRCLNKLSQHTLEQHPDRIRAQGLTSALRGRAELSSVRPSTLKYRCDECNKSFPTKRALALHQQAHARQRQRAARFFKSKRAAKNLRSSVRCALCKVACSSLPQLRLHLAQRHPGPEGDECPEPYLCPLCDKTYGAPSSLVHHRAKHSIKTTKCPICDKAYHPKYLRKHMVVHQVDRPYACDICDKSFKNSEGLRHHKLKHRPDDEKYKVYCHVCGMRFMNNGALSVHVKVVHEGLKEFGCSHCERRFGSKATAEIHERTHTGEKPFCCEVCGWRCNSKGKLRVHMRVHSDVKPFECVTCGKRTRSKNEMRQHELIHTDIKPYPCQYCEKRFRSTSQLKIHVRQHTGERPYNCPHCTRSFCDFANYSKHMHRVHKKEFELMQRSRLVYKGVPGKDLAAAGKMHLQSSSSSSSSSTDNVGDNNYSCKHLQTDSTNVVNHNNRSNYGDDCNVNRAVSCDSPSDTNDQSIVSVTQGGPVPSSAVSSGFTSGPCHDTNSVTSGLQDSCSALHSGANGVRCAASVVNSNSTNNLINSGSRQDIPNLEMISNYQTSALQLLRPGHAQHQQLLQLHLQQQQPQHLIDEPLNISQHSFQLHQTQQLQQQQQQLAHLHHQQQQQQLEHQQIVHKTQRQQLLEQLLPISLPPPPQAHQHHQQQSILPHPLPSAPHHHNSTSSSMLGSSSCSSSSSASVSSSSSSSPSLTHPLLHPSSTVSSPASCSPSMQLSSSSTLHQSVVAHQLVQSSLYPLPSLMQQTNHHQQQGNSPIQHSLLHPQHTPLSLHQQYHSAPSFGTASTNVPPGPYDPFRLPL